MKPHIGGIGRWRCQWVTAEHGFFGRLCLLHCDYFFEVRMNGGGCDRCPAWTMQGVRTLVQKSNKQVVRAADPIDPSPRPFAQPMFCYPTATCGVCSSCCTRSMCPLLLLLLEVLLCVLRAFDPCCLCCCLRNCHWCVACSTESHLATILFCDATKVSALLYDHRLAREDCAADIQYGIRPGESWLIGYSEDQVWDHTMAPIENLQCQALRDHRRPDLVALVPRYNAFLILLGMVRPMQVDAFGTARAYYTIPIWQTC